MSLILGRDQNVEIHGQLRNLLHTLMLRFVDRWHGLSFLGDGLATAAALI